MCFALCLTLAFSLGLLGLSRLCSRLLHARLVRRVGVGTTVLVGRAGDLLLPWRVYASFCQGGLGHLESCGGVVVLDCGLNEQLREECRALAGGNDRVVFLPPEKLSDYLLASARKK